MLLKELNVKVSRTFSFVISAGLSNNSMELFKIDVFAVEDEIVVKRVVALNVVLEVGAV